MMEGSLLDDIISFYLDSDVAIPLERFLMWGLSDDINVQGAAFMLFEDAEMRSRITPPVPFADFVGFHLRYYERCIRDDPSWQDDMLLSRYNACYSCRSLITWLSNPPQVDYVVNGRRLQTWLGTVSGVSRERGVNGLDVAKGWIRALYESGENEVRLALETGVLEHLFPDRRIRRFFRDWLNDPLMVEVFKRNCSGPHGAM